MRRQSQFKFTYSGVVGTLALFIALGGVSYAAVKLPKNSVGSKQIKRSAVTSSKIKNRTITSADVRAGAINADRLAPGAIASVDRAASVSVADSVGGQLKPVAKRASVSANDPSPGVAIEQAADIPLLKSGAVELVGKCYRSGTDVYAAGILRTTQDGTISFPGFGPAYFGTPYLNEGKPDAAAMVALATSNTNSVTPLAPLFGGRGIAISRDQHGVSYRFSAVAKNGTIPGGDGIYGPGDSCIFTATGSTF